MQLFLLAASLLGLATLPAAALDQPVFVSSDTRQLLFETSVEVDSTKHQLSVYDGDNPAILARDFAIKHKLDQDGMNSVLKHLKQKALITGNIKRVFFQLPVQVEKQTEKNGGATTIKRPAPAAVRSAAVPLRLPSAALIGSAWQLQGCLPTCAVAETLTEKQVITITIYEDTQPASLAKDVGTLYGLNEGQIAGLSNTIEREMVARMKLRTTVDLSQYGAGQQTLVVKKDVRFPVSFHRVS